MKKLSDGILQAPAAELTKADVEKELALPSNRACTLPKTVILSGGKAGTRDPTKVSSGDEVDGIASAVSSLEISRQHATAGSRKVFRRATPDDIVCEDLENNRACALPKTVILSGGTAGTKDEGVRR